MKLGLLFSTLLMFLSLPAFGELTAADLEKIDAMIKASEERMKEYIGQEITKVHLRIDQLDRRFTSEIGAVKKRLDDTNKRFDDVNNRLDNQFLLLLGLVGFIGVVIGIPQILVALQRKHQRTLDQKIEAQQEQIATLLKEIVTLKEQRIVRS